MGYSPWGCKELDTIVQLTHKLIIRKKKKKNLCCLRSLAKSEPQICCYLSFHSVSFKLRVVQLKQDAVLGRKRHT